VAIGQIDSETHVLLDQHNRVAARLKLADQFADAINDHWGKPLGRLVK